MHKKIVMQTVNVCMGSRNFDVGDWWKTSSLIVVALQPEG